MRTLLLALCLLASSCATDRYVSAVQRTAVGGGFVAAGITSAVGSGVGLAYTGAVMSNDGVDTSPTVFVLPILGAVLITGGLLGTGLAIMNTAEADVAAGPGQKAVAPAPRSQAQDDRRRRRRDAMSTDDEEEPDAWARPIGPAPEPED